MNLQSFPPNRLFLHSATDYLETNQWLFLSLECNSWSFSHFQSFKFPWFLMKSPAAGKWIEIFSPNFRLNHHRPNRSSPDHELSSFSKSYFQRHPLKPEIYLSLSNIIQSNDNKSAIYCNTFIIIYCHLFSNISNRTRFSTPINSNQWSKMVVCRQKSNFTGTWLLIHKLAPKLNHHPALKDI